MHCATEKVIKRGKKKHTTNKKKKTDNDFSCFSSDYFFQYRGTYVKYFGTSWRKSAFSCQSLCFLIGDKKLTYSKHLRQFIFFSGQKLHVWTKITIEFSQHRQSEAFSLSCSFRRISLFQLRGVWKQHRKSSPGFFISLWIWQKSKG